MSARELIIRAVEKASSNIVDHHEYSENSDFNDRLDGGELGDFCVYLQAPDGTTQAIEPASRALFFSDRAAYRSLLSEYRERRRAEVLRLDDYPENEAVYERLRNTVRSGATVVPFVGAGFSVAAGCPSWSSYIVRQSVRANMNEDEVRKRLADGEHELVMAEVIEAQSLNVFRREFKSSFENRKISPALSPSSEFVGLLNGSMITTNFDRVLENCLEGSQAPFREKVVGSENSGRFMKSLYAGEKYLLKLHGNIDEQRNRVLTLKEYEESYGAGEIDYSKQIPKTLKKIFGSFSVLFCGCSLVGDRYLKILKHVFDGEQDFAPEHFAILNAPLGQDEKISRDKFLAGHGISPVWYSEGDWDAPGEILKLLKEDI